MRLAWLVSCPVLVVAFACGGDDDGPMGEVDSGVVPGRDAGGGGFDAGPGVDAGPGTDAGGTPSGWIDNTPLPFVLQEISAAVVDGRIYVAGGFENRGGAVATVRIYDPATDLWTEGPPLPFPRHHVNLVELDGDLYAIGGMESFFTPLDTAFVLRSGAGSWETIQSLPETRAAAAGGGIGGRVVIAGGQGRGGLSSDTLIYDPARDVWTRGRAIPTPREHVASFVYEDRLWVVAGRELSLTSNLATVEIYDPAMDAWTDGPSMITARGGTAAAVLDDVAYVVGGEQPDRALDEAEALDLSSPTAWRSIDPVPTPRHGHAMAGVAGRVWVIGGADMPIFASVDAVESFAP